VELFFEPEKCASGELTPELKHVNQLALESTGIFAGRSQELKLHSLRYN
jgi:hypothetical protein